MSFNALPKNAMLYSPMLPMTQYFMDRLEGGNQVPQIRKDQLPPTLKLYSSLMGGYASGCINGLAIYPYHIFKQSQVTRLPFQTSTEAMKSMFRAQGGKMIQEFPQFIGRSGLLGAAIGFGLFGIHLAKKI